MLGRMLAIALGLWLLGQGLVAHPAEAEPRIALVIGNSNYGKEIGSLPNPVNDAALIARALQQTGFQVIKVVDADQKKMKRAIADFGDKLAAAGTEATGLFFYAGHGVQVRGMNYLVPVGADISKEADVDLEAVAADTVLQQMEFAGSRVNIVILDACRNNPLGRSVRDMSRGLAPMDAAQGTFVAYSTAPGQVAQDGSGKDSPYSAALAKTLVLPGIGIEEVFRDVRAQVMEATGKAQIPWDSSSLTAPFYFNGPAAARAIEPATASQPSANAQLDMAYWNAISNSKKASDYQSYLHQFPNGTFAPLAKSRLADLGVSPQAPAAAPVKPTASTQPITPAKPAVQPAAASSPAGSSVVAKSQAELALWKSISESKNPADFQAFLSQYPGGSYAPLARSRLATLRMSTGAAAPVPATTAGPAATTSPVATTVPPADTASDDSDGDSADDADDDEPIQYADTVARSARRSNYKNHKSHDSHH